MDLDKIMFAIIGFFVVLIIGVICYSGFSYEERFNNYVLECEKQGGYMFNMYNNGTFCMKGEAIKIPGYNNPGLR